MKSRTPNRSGMRTLDHSEPKSASKGTRTPGTRGFNKNSVYSEMRGGSMRQSDSEQRLNQLIEEYRQENERCTSKINDLKERLRAHQNQQSRINASNKSPRQNAEGPVYGSAYNKR